MSFPSPLGCLERLDDYHYDNEKNNKSRYNYEPVTELRSAHHFISLHENPVKLGLVLKPMLPMKLRLTETGSPARVMEEAINRYPETTCGCGQRSPSQICGFQTEF